MGKMKIGLNFCLIACILIIFFYKCLSSSFPPSIKDMCKLLILICCHGNSMAKMLNCFKLFIQVSHCGPWASGFTFDDVLGVCFLVRLALGQDE